MDGLNCGIKRCFPVWTSTACCSYRPLYRYSLQRTCNLEVAWCACVCIISFIAIHLPLVIFHVSLRLSDDIDKSKRRP